MKRTCICKSESPHDWDSECPVHGVLTDWYRELGTFSVYLPEEIEAFDARFAAAVGIEGKSHGE